jgi:hypothetical protein
MVKNPVQYQWSSYSRYAQENTISYRDNRELRILMAALAPFPYVKIVRLSVAIAMVVGGCGP